ncbi:MAG: hypothetical protein BGN84_11780 [Afipia sp. 62-7]|nr:MAG: hypothetical protein BGN84_11780 [Afipia sp. 62-7]
MEAFRGAERPARHCIVLIAASAAIFLGSQQAAFASAGCTAVNAGGFNASQASGSSTVADIRTINGFAVGDKINFSVNNGGSGQWWLNPVGGGLLLDHTAFGAGNYSYTVTGTGNDTDLQSAIRLLGAGSISVTVTCNPAAGSSSAPTDSQKLRSVQIQGSTMVAQASGAAITGAVGGAINDAFANGGAPAAFSPNGMTFNFAAEPEASIASRSDVSRRADDAFAALAYAGGGYAKAPRAAPVFERQWSLWADVHGTGWDRINSAVADIHGTQLNATAGLGYKLNPDVLVGAFGGYESFNYDFASLAGNLKGNGGTVGGYAAWRITQTLRWDAMAGWSGLSYDGVAGTASGSFTGSRWIASTGLTGNYRVAAYIFEPSAKVYALWERQGAWIDSLGASQASRDFSTGRVSAGGRVIAPWQITATTILSPYLGFYGDWRFSTDNALPVGVPFVGISDGWSGRVTGGVNIATAGGGSLALGGEYGGIGSNYGVWTASARAHWPF